MSGFQMDQAAQYANPLPPTSTTSISVPPGAPVQPAQAQPQAPAPAPTPQPPQPPTPAPANPFDQFDAPQAKAAAPQSGAAQNPFDQFDAPPAVPAYQQQPGYQQALKQVQTGALDTGAGGAVLGVENGLTFNNADRINGAANAATQYVQNLFTGSQGKPTPGQMYDATRDAVNTEDQNFSAAHPVASIASNIVGGLPIGAGIGKAVLAAPSAVARVGAAIGTGAASGAAYGAGTDKSNPIQGAENGGEIGAFLAPAGMAVGAGARIAGNAINNIARPGALEASAQTRAAQYLANQSPPLSEAAPVAQLLNRALTPGEQAVAASLSKQGMAPADIATALKTPVANGGLTVAETLGQQGTGMTAALTRKPGIAGDLANTVLGARQAGRTDRLVSGFTAATGVDPIAARANVEQMIAQGQDSVNPAYTAIRADPSPVMTPGLQNLFDSDPNIQKALGTVNSVTRNAPPVPTAATWLAVRQQLSDGVARNQMTDKPLASYANAQMGNAARDLGDELNDAIPGFEDAQAQAALYKAPQASYTAARGMLFGGTAKQTPADVQSLWNAAKTPDQQQAIQHAFAADFLDRAVNKNTLTPGVLQAPGVQQKLSIVFGPDAAANLSSLAQNEQKMSQFAARVMPNNNSITAEAQNYGDEGLKQAFLAGATKAAGHVLEGDPHRAGFAAVSHAVKYLAGVGKANSDLAFRNALAQQYLGDAATFAPGAVASTKSIAVLPGMVNAANQVAAAQQAQQ